jgi:hypothetical protein
MRLLSRPDVGALVLAAVLVPRPGTAADALHPLDPAAKAGSIPTENIFDGYVPLLDRDEPLPSFVPDDASAQEGSAEAEPAPDGMPMDHDGMDHGGMAPGSMDHGAMDHGAMGHGTSQPPEAE